MSAGAGTGELGAVTGVAASRRADPPGEGHPGAAFGGSREAGLAPLVGASTPQGSS